MAEQDQTKNKGAAKPADAAPKASTSKSSKRSDAKASSPRAGLALVVAVLGLVAALAVAGGGYWLWLQLGAARAASAQQRSADAAALTALRQDLAGQLQSLQQAQGQAEQRRRALEQSLHSIRQLSARDRNDWVLAEAEYLMRLANERLQLMGDVPTAIAALSAADDRLRDLGDPGLTPVREQLAGEIAALRAVPKPDIDGMALQLEGLSAQVDKLSTGVARLGQSLKGTAPAASAAAAAHKGWRQTLEGVWKELRTLVVIRRHDRPVRPLLSPEQESLVREVLRLKLAAARAALVNRDQALFRGSVGSARAWLQARFDVHNAAVASMLEQLGKLAAVDVRPTMPDISGSLRSLRRLIEQRRAAGPAAPTPPKAQTGSAESAAPVAKPATAPAAGKD